MSLISLTFSPNQWKTYLTSTMNLALQKRRHRYTHLNLAILVSILIFSLTACSINPMLIRIAYERFPSHISSELSNLADFNQEQLSWITNASTHHHNWHRTTQLPLYVALIDGLAKQVQNDRTLNLNYFDSLISESRTLLMQINECNPALYATQEIKHLSDIQVEQIRQNLQRKLNKNKSKYISKNSAQRGKRRFSKIKKLFSYAKLNLNDVQNALLRRTIDKQVSLGMRRFELTEQWNMEFVYILQSRHTDGFAENVEAHIAKRWQLVETAEPEIWTETHANWRNFAAALMESLTEKQRKKFGAWLSKMSRTLNTLANEKLQKVELPSPLSTVCSSHA